MISCLKPHIGRRIVHQVVEPRVIDGAIAECQHANVVAVVGGQCRDKAGLARARRPVEEVAPAVGNASVRVPKDFSLINQTYQRT